MAEEVERLKGRNAALLDAEAKEAERRARLEAGVATALASFEGEARRLYLAYISPTSPLALALIQPGAARTRGGRGGAALTRGGAARERGAAPRQRGGGGRAETR